MRVDRPRIVAAVRANDEIRFCDFAFCPRSTPVRGRGAVHPGPNSYVRVQIFRHTLGGSFSSGVCTSNDNAMYAITTCSLPAINFNSGDLYTAVVSSNRTSTSVQPIFNGFRLY